MNTDPFDLVVIGGGVGGCTAAIAAARRGLRVGIVEASAEPHQKVCGEFLSPEIQQTLKRIGALDPVEAAGAGRVTDARVFSYGHDSGSIPLSGTALTLSRKSLDSLLWKLALEAGVTGLRGARVRDIDEAGELIEIAMPAEIWRARFVIAATGRNSRLAKDEAATPAHNTVRYLGIKTHFLHTSVPDGVVELHAFEGGYCGLVNVEDGMTDVCFLISYRADRGARPEKAWDEILSHCPDLADRVAGATPSYPWLATANVSFGRRHPANGRILLCGDAAGYIHPFTGDGMSMAARAGELAASTVAASILGGLKPLDVAPVYTAAWHREFGPRLSFGRRLHPLVTNPFLAIPSIALVRRFPALGQLWVRLTRG